MPNQDPDTIAQRGIAHVHTHAPSGVRVSAWQLPFRAHSVPQPAGHPGNDVARGALGDLYGREPYYVRTGGSIPIVMLFLQHLGVHTVNFGFGLPDEQLHAPDEFSGWQASSADSAATSCCCTGWPHLMSAS